MEKVGIIGAGGWGTALSIVISSKFDVILWERFPEYAEILTKKRENPEFLPGFKIPEKIKITSDFFQVGQESSIVIIAVPSKYFRNTLRDFKPFYRSQAILIATKGLEIETGKRMSEIVTEELKESRIAVISGPTIASEVAAGKPTAAVIASNDMNLATRLQQAFSTNRLRLYTSVDVCGVEICGAYKNVIAIGAGVIDGLNLGDNAKASYLTRSIEEMKNFGKIFGAKKKTFWGLAGLGDLVTTSFSPCSRNHRFGQALAAGKQKEFLSGTKMFVEGIPASRAIKKICEENNFESPIAFAVYRMVFEGSKPFDELEKLMTRKLKNE